MLAAGAAVSGRLMKEGDRMTVQPTRAHWGFHAICFAVFFNSDALVLQSLCYYLLRTHFWEGRRNCCCFFCAKRNGTMT